MSYVRLFTWVAAIYFDRMLQSYKELGPSRLNTEVDVTKLAAAREEGSSPNSAALPKPKHSLYNLMLCIAAAA